MRYGAASLALLATLAFPMGATGQDVPLPMSMTGGPAVQSFSTTTATTSGTVRNRFVEFVGVHATHDLAFFSLRGGMPDCLYQLVYIRMNVEGGRAAYATVLSAARSEAPLDWVNYAVQSNGSCAVNTLAG